MPSLILRSHPSQSHVFLRQPDKKKMRIDATGDDPHNSPHPGKKEVEQRIPDSNNGSRKNQMPIWEHLDFCSQNSLRYVLQK